MAIGICHCCAPSVPPLLSRVSLLCRVAWDTVSLQGNNVKLAARMSKS